MASLVVLARQVKSGFLAVDTVLYLKGIIEISLEVEGKCTLKKKNCQKEKLEVSPFFRMKTVRSKVINSFSLKTMKSCKNWWV